MVLDFIPCPCSSRIQTFKSNLCIQGEGIGSLGFLAECGCDTQAWSPSGVVDLLELQDNFIMQHLPALSVQ
jgi:hypothetical protein